MIPIKDKEEKKAPEKEAPDKTEKEAPEEEVKEAEQAAEEPAPEKEETPAEAPAEEKKPEEKAVSEEMALLNDKYLRICAEYDNYRKRTQKEKDNLYGDIRANVITSFLPVYDNLTRALAAATTDEAYRKGVELIMNQFNATMEKLGVTEIKAVGEKFDPAVHNAVMHVNDETKGENEVVEEFQKGFKIGDKVIRFSMVKVAN
jgi:molecular chaperone GrpE